MTRSPRLRAAALAAALAVPAVAVALPGFTGASASTPGASTLAVPAVGAASTTSAFTGTAPVLANPTSDCSSVPAASTDRHDLTLSVPAGFYDAASVTLAFKVTWTPGAENDLILTVVDADGAVVGNSDGSGPEENVALTDPAAGTYTAIVCGFANGAPQDFAGTVTASTASLTAAPPSTPAGLGFTASAASDPQKSQGEPAVTIDDAGIIYTCGTNGFSNATDHASVSLDGGDSFQLMGPAPTGTIGTTQAGGDCALATGQDRNSDGTYTLAYSGLGPLTGFSTFSTVDNGRTLRRSPTQNTSPTNQLFAVDRQWITFSDANTAFLNYNALAMGQIVQKSVDGGLTYGPSLTVATDGGRLGQIRTIKEGTIAGQTDDIVYFPYSAGTTVKLAMSQDGGTTWSQCVAVDAEIDPTAGFPAADHDAAGNLYVTYTEKGGPRDTYLVALPAAKVAGCQGPNPVADSDKNDVNPGFGAKIRMNRDGVETTVMPWVVAGGVSGRAAVAYYGTESVGDPDAGDFAASWNVYVSQVLDVFAATPAVDMAKATSHPFHYDSICLGGLGCDTSVPAGDRSLVDYFTMALDKATGRLVIVYSQPAKIPGEPEGSIATPVVVRQNAGPSNLGGTVTADPAFATVRTGSQDATGDALYGYNNANAVLGSPVLTTPSVEPAGLDLTGVEVLPAVDPATGAPLEGGGMTVELRVADLSDAALQAALSGSGSTEALFLFRFVDGYQASAVGAYWNPIGGFRFGLSGYEPTSRNPGGNVLTYPGGTPVPGAVDQEAGTITLTVPLAALTALSGSQGADSRPEEVPAVVGSRVFDAQAMTLLSAVPVGQAQSYLTQVDGARSFDFLVPGAAPAEAGGTGGTDGGTGGTGGTGNGSGGTTGGTVAGGTLATTGGLGAPVLALLVLGAAGLAWRRVRA